MQFNSREYEWSDVSVVLAGRPLTGIQGVKYTTKQEKEAVYGKGNKPMSVQRGNKSYEGEMTLLQSEYEALRAACGGDILDASFDMIVQYGNPSKGDVITIDVLKGVEFTEDATQWAQGDKYQAKTLPIIFLDRTKKKETDRRASVSTSTRVNITTDAKQQMK